MKQIREGELQEENFKSRLNLYLGPDLSKKLTEYTLKIATARGRMPTGIRQAIGQLAINEYLKKHGNDLTIDFEKELKNLR